MKVLKKIWFIASQLSGRQKIDFLKDYLFKRRSLRRNKRKYYTYIFFEERFKRSERVCRANNLNIVRTRIGLHAVDVYVRRFTSDMLVYRQLLEHNEILPIVRLFRNNGVQPKYFVDGGANIGLCTLFMKAFFPELQGVLVEPNGETFEVLKKNIIGNSLAGCTLLHKGLWSSLTVLEPDNDGTGPNMEWSFSLKTRSATSKGNGISCTSVTELMRELDWPYIDYLKVDVEGAERELFRSEELYSGFLTKVRCISVEVHDADFEQTLEGILKAFNFRVTKSGELIVGDKFGHTFVS